MNALVQNSKANADVELVVMKDGMLRTSLETIVDRLNAEEETIQYKSAIQLIRQYLSDFEDENQIAFETRAGSERPQGGFGKGKTIAWLTEEQATLFMTYLRNSEVVRKFKKTLVKEFFRLRQAQTPQTRLEWIEFALAQERALVEQSQLIEHQQAKIEMDAPKVEFVDDYLLDDAWHDIGDVSDQLGGIGRNKLFSKLREWGLVDNDNRPYQKYINLGWFRVMNIRGKGVNAWRVFPTTFASRKGVFEIHKLLNQDMDF